VARFLSWIQGLAATLGGPGLFLLSFLDSSFLSFPEVTDILIIVLVTKHPDWLLWYTLMPTIGSVLGSWVIFALARRGGEAFMRKRMSAQNVERAFAVVRKYGLLAVAIPSVMPPPVPFKIFVLAAGAARVRTIDFLIAVSLGRGVRYIGEGVLAFYYGKEAEQFLMAHGKTISFWMAAVLVVGGALWIWWSRRGDRVDGSSGSSV
jgi:membrane protein YqaA with SNARE-associated domain